MNVQLPLSQLVDHLGMPDCILPNPTPDPSHQTVIFWERYGVSIGAVLTADAAPLNLNATTLALWLRDTQPGDCTLPGALAWRGFAPAWYYGG